MSSQESKNPVVRLFKSLTPADHAAALLLILTTIQTTYLVLNQGWKPGFHFLLGGTLLVLISSAMFFPLKKWVNPKKKYVHALISTLMLFIILNHDAHDLLTGIVLLLVVYLAKFGLQYQKKAIFNPLALSVALVTLLAIPIPWIKDPGLTWDGLRATFTWFGVLVPLPLFFLTLSIFTNARRIRRIPLALTYVAVALGLGYLVGNVSDWMLFVTGTLFMGSLVVIEPRTSPVKVKQQLLYGAVAAGLFVLFLQLSVPSASMVALCVVNLGYFAFRQMKQNKQQSK